MELYEYLLENYGYDEPIFSEELALKLKGYINQNTLRVYLKRLTDSEKISRFPNKEGIYFIPKPNRILKNSKGVLSLNKVLNQKYIVKNNERIGYISGFKFANSLQLTTQVASLTEIVTQTEKSQKRSVDYNGIRVILRKPKVPVTENNYKILQVLDLLNNFSMFSEVPLEKAKPIILNYVKDVNMDSEDFVSILKLYPRTIEKVMESGLFNELAQRNRSISRNNRSSITVSKN